MYSIDTISSPFTQLELPAHLRVAIVHEWLESYAGSERVVEQIIKLVPNADLYVVADFLPQDQRSWLQGKSPRTTFIQRLPFAKRIFRNYLPLMPLAVEALDLSAYDLILSSSHSVAKGVLTGPDQIHVCYCHTPIRYAWDLQHQYLRESGTSKYGKTLLSRLILHYMKLWDVRTANGVNQFIANSAYIARRIKKAYQRDATVVHPPVDLNYFQLPSLASSPEDYYLVASRLVPYKKVEMVVEAFAKYLPGQRLLVVGDGPQMQRCKAAAGPNVTLLGYQSRTKLLNLLQRAKAFVFAAEEDFGISIVEAQACGTPVICYSRGGASEIVLNGETGLFFQEQSPSAVADAIHTFEGIAENFNRLEIRRNAERFSTERFCEDYLRVLHTALQSSPRLHSDLAVLPSIAAAL